MNHVLTVDKKEIHPQYIRANDSCLLTPPNTQEKGPSLTPLEYVDTYVMHFINKCKCD